MAPFFVYLLKSSVSLAIFYIVFRLAMSRDKNHSLNRFLLLGILAVSAIIPFLNFQLFKEEMVIQPVSVIRDFIYTPIEFADIPQTAPAMATEPVQKGIEINWWLLGYSVAIAALFIRLVISLLRVVQLVRESEKLPLNKFIIAVIKEMVQPFSFLRYIVISEKDYTENRKAVLAHEQEHIRQLHSIDLLVCEMFTLLHWFNPFMWLLRRDLKMVHEFQADQAVLNTGIDAKKYQLLVIEKAVGERRFALANHFTHKPILKRINMMKKKKISKWNGLKLVLFIPVVAVFLMAYSKIDKINSNEGTHSPGIVAPERIITGQNNPTILIKESGNYIDDKKCSINEIVNKVTDWGKNEEILLNVQSSVSFFRVDEVREALNSAEIYHVNLSLSNSDDIIYPAGDVSATAKFTQGSWNNWINEQLSNVSDGQMKNWEYKIKYGFIIDSQGRVSEGHIIQGSENAKVNEVFQKVLKMIPDWEPAQKGGVPVSVFYSEMSSRRSG